MVFIDLAIMYYSSLIGLDGCYAIIISHIPTL